MKKVKKIANNSKKLAIIAVALLLIIVILFILISGAFYSASGRREGEIALGDIDFTLVSSGQDGTILPNMDINQSLIIKNSRNAQGTDSNKLCNILYRFKIFPTIDNIVDSSLIDLVQYNISYANYIKASDGTYYFLGYLAPGGSQTIFDGTHLSSQIGNQYQGTQLNYLIQVDAIQAENDAYQFLWSDAPQNWLNQISVILDF